MKPEASVNYEGTRKFKPQFEKLMDSYLEVGQLRWATEEEAERVVINPLNCLEVKAGKYEIICHALLNACYRKMPIDLVDVTKKGEVLSEIDIFQIEDLKSCYSGILNLN